MRNYPVTFSESELKRLNYPCIFCGGDMFSVACGGATVGDVTANKHCLVLGKIPIPNAPHGCHHFCLFACNKRNIIIDGFPNIDCQTEVTNDECESVNKEYDDKFKSFSLLLENRGFEI